MRGYIVSGWALTSPQQTTTQGFFVPPATEKQHIKTSSFLATLFEWFNRTKMSQNKTLISCLAKKGQDQHFKLTHQSHILFYKVLFDKEHLSPPPKANICDKNSLCTPGTLFFLIPRFQKFGTKVCPPQQKGVWGGGLKLWGCNKTPKCLIFTVAR